MREQQRYAAAVVRQPYRVGCRAVTPWQPQKKAFFLFIDFDLRLTPANIGIPEDFSLTFVHYIEYCHQRDVMNLYSFSVYRVFLLKVGVGKNLCSESIR